MISLKNYIKKLNFYEMTEFEKIKHISYYLYSAGVKEFEIELLVDKLKENGFYISNLSRLKRRVRDSKLFKKVTPDTYTLTTVAHNELKTLNQYFESEEVEVVEMELLEMNIFCGHTNYLNKLVLQANKCYEEKCYDACATMLRRILEILLIKSYEELGIEQNIKDSNGNYFLLEKICNDAKTNTSLNLSRIKNKLDILRNIGNYAAHRITYNTTKKDIDEIKVDLRVILEELLYKANFIQ
ncbi:MAG: DUF4145 domain-containing protein [Bacilli bacterium]|nr:DUF4145 domain-containing protein [Bacilli bacterium]